MSHESSVFSLQSSVFNPQSSVLSPQSDRVVAALLGLAMGDALGAPVMGWSAERIQQRLGSVEDYPDLWRTPGLYTARTQQALCLVDTLLEDNQFDPVALAGHFVRMSKALHQKWPIYGAFRATSQGFRDAVDRLAEGIPWDQAGTVSAGNDPAVRVAPLALWSREKRVIQFREDVARSAWLTHRDPRAVAGALALGYALLYLINVPSVDKFEAKTFLRDVAGFVETCEGWMSKFFWTPDLNLPRDSVKDLSSVLGRAERWLGFSTPALLEQVTRFSRPLGDGQVRATSPFTVASVTTALLIFARRGAHLHEVLVTAVNLGGDTSGIGAMVGAMAGALHGTHALPATWLAGLQNAEALRQRAVALAEGTGIPPGAPKLTRMEAAHTEAEIPRLKAKHEGAESED